MANLIKRQDFAFAQFFFERLARQPLHGDVGKRAFGTDLVNRHYVGMFDCRGRASFSNESLSRSFAQ